MRHRRQGRKLGRDAAHRDALMMNLTASLIEHGRIKTTLTKAKEVRPYAEKLVTAAKTDSVHARRTVLKKLRLHDTESKRKAGEPTVLRKLFTEIGPRFVDRPGGYTRIVKLGPRPGDAADMAFIEWVDYQPTPRSARGGAAGGAAAHTHDHEHAGHSHA